MTLIEVLITVALVAFVMGLAMLGFGATTSARLKRSAVLIASASKVAYNHANASSKSVRLVFDFDRQAVILEESTDVHLVEQGKRAGGAMSPEEAVEATQSLLTSVQEGVQSPRAEFEPREVFGFDWDKDLPGKELSTAIRFYQVEADHLEEPVTDKKAYLHFFPGGQAQRAAIQLSVANPDLAEESDFMTILISPLTGDAEIRKGRIPMPRPREDVDASDRLDLGY